LVHTGEADQSIDPLYRCGGSDWVFGKNVVLGRPFKLPLKRLPKPLKINFHAEHRYQVPIMWASHSMFELD